MIIKFTVQGKPVGKARPRFARGHTYTPKTTSDYEKLVAQAYKFNAKGINFADKAVGLHITANYPIPKSMPKFKRLAAVAHKLFPKVKPDGDNVMKIIADGLNGIAYDDDSQVVDWIFRKRYSENACVEVSVYDIEE